MDNKFVTVVDGESEGRAGTFLIAQGFGRRHEQVVRLVKKYQSDFEDFSTLKVSKVRGKGRPVEEFLLNEDQFLFLGTIFKNSKVVIAFKKKVILEYAKVRRMLYAAKSQHSNHEWLMSRDFGKQARLMETKAIQSFVKYAEAQGSKNANKYYMNITRMMNGLLFIFAGKFKNIRDILTPTQLMTVSSAEQIISKGLQDSMDKKMYYKDVYKEVKRRVMMFAELHGQTEVIDKQLLLAKEDLKLTNTETK